MGKPKGRNAFFHFLLATQNDLRRENRNLSLNSPELQSLANSKWSVMSKEERGPYERRAQQEKGKTTIQVTPKPYHETSSSSSRPDVDKRLHLAANDMDEDEDERQDYYHKMIECCVKACQSREQLLNASFFVIATNVMCKTDKNEFPPLEIAICQYSIKNGIQFTYHEFIDAGSVPLGYMHSAKAWANETHKIPLSDFMPAVNNYEKLVEDIKQILEESRFTNSLTEKPTPMLLFCREDAIVQNRSVLQWLSNKYNQINGTAFQWDLEVLDLVILLYHISSAANHPITIPAGEGILTSSAFDYSANSLCDFHEEMDNNNCAKGLARRLCYLLSTALLPIFNITPTDKHLPPKRDVVSETYVANLLEVKPLPAYRYHENVDANEDEWEPNGDEQEGGSEGDESVRPKSLGIGRGRGRMSRND